MSPHKSQQFFADLCQWISTHAKQIVLFYLLATVCVVYYTINNLSFHTDTQDMIAEHLDWRQDYIQYKNTFPLNHRTILAIIEGESQAQVDAASERFYRALQADEQFEHVFNLSLDPFFQQHQLLYLEVETLKALNKQWPSMIPLRHVQTDDLPVLLATLQQALQSQAGREMFQPVWPEWIKTLQYNQQNKPYIVSWEPVFNVPKSKWPVQIIQIKPNINYETMLPGLEQVQSIQATFDALDLAEIYGVKLKLTGEIVLNLEELESVNQGAGLAAIGAFLMVAILLMLSFKSVWLVIIGLTTLIIGLCLTAGFATLSIGHLNMISVAFAVLYIGLSIDFTIHLIMRYKECARRNDLNALKTTLSHLGPPLLFCALTTSVAFFSFLPTSFKGVSELGVIAGSGMLISFVINVTLLPALLTLKGVQPQRISSSPPTPLLFYPYKMITLGFIVAIMGAIWLLPKVEFNADPMDLRDPKQPSVMHYYEIQDKATQGPGAITVLTTDTELAQLSSKLESLDSVKQVHYLSRFIPGQQQEKLDILSQLAKHPSPKKVPESKHTVKESIDALVDFQKSLDKLENKDETLIQFEQALTQYLENLSKEVDVVQDVRVRALSHNIMLGLVRFMNTLSNHANSIVTEDSLPQGLKDLWQQNEIQRLDVIPAQSMQDEQAQAAFVRDVLTIAPHATGLPVIHQKAGDAVVDAFQQAFSIALLLITLLLLWLMRSLKQVCLTLVPLLSACVLTGAASVLLDIPFNFANIIALPLLLGLGIDNGIHLVHRFYAHPGESLRHSSTSKAVIASTLTTILSFMNLSFSKHMGMSSMGTMLTTGMLITLACTLIFLPALLYVINGKNKG